MPKNFKSGDVVKFTKKTFVFNVQDKTKFEVPAGTKGQVVIDQDAGETGSIRILLDLAGGGQITCEADGKNLEKTQ